MRFMSGIAFLLALLLAASAATADDSYKKQNVTRTVMSGVKTKIGQHYHINGDCTVAPMPPTKVVKLPSHGKIEIVNEKIYPKSRGPLEKCNSIKISGLSGYYTSKPGYSGKDEFILRAPVGDGKIADKTITVMVLK